MPRIAVVLNDEPLEGSFDTVDAAYDAIVFRAAERGLTSYRVRWDISPS